MWELGTMLFPVNRNVCNNKCYVKVNVKMGTVAYNCNPHM